MKKFPTMSMLNLFLLVVLTLSVVHCQDDDAVERDRCDGSWWKQFGNGCYYYFHDPKGWHSARKMCQGYGSDLVCISSREENDFVTDMTQGTKSWIGLRDKYPYADMTDPREKTEDQWLWTDTSPYRYTNWAEGQPSGIQDCVQINYGGKGKWDDEDYWMKLGFVCEKPQIEN